MRQYLACRERTKFHIESNSFVRIMVSGPWAHYTEEVCVTTVVRDGLEGGQKKEENNNNR